MKKLLLLSALAVGPAASFAVNWAETEANDTWLTPNVTTGVVAGDTFSGVTTGTSTTTAGLASADHFKVGMAAQAMGIYRNRLELTNSPGHVGALVGRTSSTTSMASSAIQSTSTTTSPARFNQWYSFGTAHEVLYKVTGAATTTAGYSAVLTQSLVTPTVLAAITAGSHTLHVGMSGGTTDSEIMIFDTAGNVLGLNDDIGTGTATLNSQVVFNFVAGQQYIIGVGRHNTASNSAQAPGDYQGASYFTTGNYVASSSSSTATTTAILSLDGNAVGTSVWNPAGAATDHYKVDFYTVRAVPEPTSMAALGLGVAALARRRRNKK
ncbi:MAG: PEP-CTERM sorting domain-containing protein [Fimbriimonadaceae bacterium]|nr:PEP-CTERM sorting domain-containing protein [Fimbriimonadaceae bacterium]